MVGKHFESNWEKAGYEQTLGQPYPIIKGSPRNTGNWTRAEERLAKAAYQRGIKRAKKEQEYSGKSAGLMPADEVKAAMAEQNNVSGKSAGMTNADIWFEYGVNDAREDRSPLTKFKLHADSENYRAGYESVVGAEVSQGPSGIDATLAERGSRYGKFTDHAKITQRLKSEMISHPGWAKLACDQAEALDMIAHKIGRILCGDPNYADSWHDIAGYAKLVDDRLNGDAK